MRVCRWLPFAGALGDRPLTRASKRCSLARSGANGVTEERRDVRRGGKGHRGSLLYRGLAEEEPRTPGRAGGGRGPAQRRCRGEGREAWKRTFLPFFEGFPDLELSIEFMVAEGDMVALRWTAMGTHNGEFRGISATGRRINVTGIAVYRVSGGRIVELWSQPDALGLLRQIGAIPEPG
ncbi:MAG: ester cyclase [Alphaproteobacteria bacterium]